MVILASEMTFIRKESFLNVKIQRQIIHDKNARKFSDNTETLRAQRQLCRSKQNFQFGKSVKNMEK